MTCFHDIVVDIEYVWYCFLSFQVRHRCITDQEVRFDVVQNVIFFASLRYIMFPSYYVRVVIIKLIVKWWSDISVCVPVLADNIPMAVFIPDASINNQPLHKGQLA